MSPNLLNRRVNETNKKKKKVQSKPFAHLLDGAWFLVLLHRAGGKECVFSGPASGERLPGEKPCRAISPQTLTFVPGDLRLKNHLFLDNENRLRGDQGLCPGV